MITKSKWTLVVATMMFAMAAYAGHAEVSSQTEVNVNVSVEQRAEFETRLQQQYNVSANDIKLLRDSRFSTTQQAKVAAAASLSRMSIAEVLRMRLDQKMGWGRIAHELNIRPQDIAQSVRKFEQDHRVMIANKVHDRRERISDRKDKLKERISLRKEAVKDRVAEKKESVKERFTEQNSVGLGAGASAAGNKEALLPSLSKHSTLNLLIE